MREFRGAKRREERNTENNTHKRQPSNGKMNAPKGYGLPSPHFGLLQLHLNRIILKFDNRKYGPSCSDGWLWVGFLSPPYVYNTPHTHMYTHLQAHDFASEGSDGPTGGKIMND